jgi:hypothetical protein
MNYTNQLTNELNEFQKEIGPSPASNSMRAVIDAVLKALPGLYQTFNEPVHCPITGINQARSKNLTVVYGCSLLEALSQVEINKIVLNNAGALPTPATAALYFKDVGYLELFKACREIHKSTAVVELNKINISCSMSSSLASTKYKTSSDGVVINDEFLSAVDAYRAFTITCLTNKHVLIIDAEYSL